MSLRLRFLTCFALVLLLTPALSASTAIHLSTREMTESADLILTGQCVSAKTQWVGNTLVTFAEIAVGETLKGQAGSTVTVALPGGIDASREVPVAVTYAGAPRISPNEQVFLFLADASKYYDSAFTVAGFSQGKYTVVESPAGATLVRRDLTELNLQESATSSLVTKGSADSLSFASFRAEVEGYLNADGSQR